MKILTVALCTFAVMAAAVYAQTSNLSGHPRVIDGDTIVLGSKHIRIFGIDAPESDQTCHDDNGSRWFCGEVATLALSGEINGRVVSCDQKDTDRYGRIVAICYVDGRDIGAAMVLHGWAVDYARYSHGLYSVEEKAASAGKRGIWRGTFELPEYWRREHRERHR